ncbi:hypothetical protein BDV93DRAFT_511384 [Ceratobasidium sp. AG-I]|nr:hypothetical protein BDV93DRAFT_511384 [Ceratobasidium sp. AG-I]
MSHVLRILEKWLPQEKLFRETISLQYEEPHKDRKFRQNFEVEPGFWSGVTALGYAASLSNQGCLGIQTGHRPKQCDRAFSYLKIDTILSMKWQADPAFRNG